MAKRKRMHEVRAPKKNDLFVGTIDLNEIRRKVRKPQPPPTQRHRSKKDYRRKPKHPGQEAAE